MGWKTWEVWGGGLGYCPVCFFYSREGSYRRENIVKVKENGIAVSKRWTSIKEVNYLLRGIIRLYTQMIMLLLCSSDQFFQHRETFGIFPLKNYWTTNKPTHWLCCCCSSPDFLQLGFRCIQKLILRIVWAIARLLGKLRAQLNVFNASFQADPNFKCKLLN